MLFKMTCSELKNCPLSNYLANMKIFLVSLLSLAFVFFIFSCEKDEPEPADEDPGDEKEYDPTPYDLETPRGFPPLPEPTDNPLTEEGIELGRMLFHDPILSKDSTQSCESCHNQDFAFTDSGNRFSEGVDGSIGERTSQPIVNIAWSDRFFWDGRAETLEEQVRDPIINPIEMKLPSMDVAVDRLERHDDYPDMIFEAFGDEEVKEEHILKSIAQFMRIIISSDSPFDRWRRGEGQISEAAQRGFNLFNAEIGEGGDCFHCHGTALFTDHQFRNNALDSVFDDPGLAGVTGDESDMGLFKTPTLRNVAVSGPYMHDGRFETLEEVMEHYNSGGVESPTVDPFMKGTGRGGLNLTEREKQDIIAFLESLTDTTFLNEEKFSDPFE